MLAVWREWGLPEVLEQAWHSGIILAGISAGNVLVRAGPDRLYDGALKVMDCLGFLNAASSRSMTASRKAEGHFTTSCREERSSPDWQWKTVLLSNLQGG